MEVNFNGLRLKKFVLAVLVVTVFLTVIAGGKAMSASAALGAQVLPSLADLADKVKFAVVNISTTKVVKGHPLQPFLNPDSPFRDFFGDEFFKHFFGDNPPQGGIKTHSLG